MLKKKTKSSATPYKIEFNIPLISQNTTKRIENKSNLNQI